MNTIDLSGRVAVVTGGARGIGFATAERLLRSGAKVAIWDIDGARAKHSAKELAALGTASAHPAATGSHFIAQREHCYTEAELRAVRERDQEFVRRQQALALQTNTTTVTRTAISP